MSIVRNITLATLLATASVATAVPMASAQDSTPAASAPAPQAEAQGPRAERGKFNRGPGRQMQGGGPRGMQRGTMGMPLVSLSCGPDAAERLETRYDRLAERLELTDAQTTLFNALKTEALTAQTSFADTCPTPPAPAAEADAATPPTPPNPVDRLEQQLEMDGHRISALTGLLPELKAFYESLDADQLAKLRPDRMARNGDDRGPGMRQHRGPAGHMDGQHEGRNARPAGAPQAAPSDTDTPRG